MCVGSAPTSTRLKTSTLSPPMFSTQSAMMFVVVTTLTAGVSGISWAAGEDAGLVPEPEAPGWGSPRCPSCSSTRLRQRAARAPGWSPSRCPARACWCSVSACLGLLRVFPCGGYPVCGPWAPAGRPLDIDSEYQYWQGTLVGWDHLGFLASLALEAPVADDVELDSVADDLAGDVVAYHPHKALNRCGAKFADVPTPSTDRVVVVLDTG